MGHSRPLFRLVSSFQTNNAIFTTNKLEKIPSRIRFKPTTITTRPGLFLGYCAISSSLFLCFPLYPGRVLFNAVSVTGLGDYWIFLATNFTYRSSQKDVDFWGYFEKYHLTKRNCFATICLTFVYIWATFYFNIWSHWTLFLFLSLLLSVFVPKCLAFQMIIQFRASELKNTQSGRLGCFGCSRLVLPSRPTA